MTWDSSSQKNVQVGSVLRTWPMSQPLTYIFGWRLACADNFFGPTDPWFSYRNMMERDNVDVPLVIFRIPISWKPKGIFHDGHGACLYEKNEREIQKELVDHKDSQRCEHLNICRWFQLVKSILSYLISILGVNHLNKLVYRTDGKAVDACCRALPPYPRGD